MAWSNLISSSIARAMGLSRPEPTPSPDVQPVPVPEEPPGRAEADGWDLSALTGEKADDPMKQLPVIQPQVDTPEPPAAPVATERTAGMLDDPERHAALEPGIVSAMRTVFDPEIPVNIYDLGLIYDVIVEASSAVGIRMTLTAPNCPAAQWLPGQVEDKVRRVEGVTDVRLDVVFDPPWDKDRMSDAAKLQLGMW
jgi:FeS assembly SUF system protein